MNLASERWGSYELPPCVGLRPVVAEVRTNTESRDRMKRSRNDSEMTVYWDTSDQDNSLSVTD